MQTRWYHNLGLIVLAAAIALSPRFIVGQLSGGIPGSRIIEIRIEDLILTGLILLWVMQFLLSKQTTFQKPPLFSPIITWLGFGLLTTLVNIILGNIEPLRAFFFFLKETEFFLLYFYVFYHVRNLQTAKLMVSIWIILGALNSGWIIFELLTNLKITYYYGPTLFAEPGNPFGSGVFFLTIFIFFFNIFLYYTRIVAPPLKKLCIGIATIIPVVGVFASGSSASFLGFIFSFLATLFMYFIKTKVKNFPAASLIIIFILFVTLLIGPGAYTIRRQTSLQKFLWDINLVQTTAQGPVGSSRADIWKFYLRKSFQYPLAPFIGFGKSFVGEAHSQYVRNFVETGVIGSVLFLLLVFTILIKSAKRFLLEKDHFYVGISSAILITTIAMLIISLPAESFIYGAKISELYWFLIGIGFAALSCKNPETTTT